MKFKSILIAATAATTFSLSNVHAQTGFTYNNSTKDRITVPASGIFNYETFTIEALIKTTVGGTIISKRTTGSDGFLFLTYNGGTQLLLQISGVSGGNHLSQTFPSIFDGNCHHVAVTFNKPTVTFYVDGVARGTSYTTRNAYSSGSIFIGHDIVDNASFTGDINEVRYWYTVRTASEIANNIYTVWPMIINQPTQPGLIGYWRFKENGIDRFATHYDVKDYSNYGNHGITGNNAGTTTFDPTRIYTSCYSGDRQEDENTFALGLSSGDIYPNPAMAGELLNLINLSEGQQSIRILDSKGKVISEQAVTPLQGKATLNLAGIDPGLYVVSTVTGATKIVIK